METYRKELLKLNKKGPLTAETIVNTAKNPKSPLHKYFEWDDTAAGKKYRLYQARQLINIVIEPIETTEQPVYSFEIVKTERGREYKHVGEILDNEEYRQQLLDAAIRELSYWKGKYAYYSIGELTAVIDEITEVERRFVKNATKEKNRIKSRTVTASA